MLQRHLVRGDDVAGSVVHVRARRFQVEFDHATGLLSSVRHVDHAGGLDFLLNESGTLSDLGLGSVRIRWRSAGGRKWEIRGTSPGRPVEVLRPGAKRIGVLTRSDRGGTVQVASRFRLEHDDVLRWRVTVRNVSKASIEVGEVSFPLPFNTRYVAPDQRALYEERVTVDPFVAGHGSYVLVQALCGRAPFLLFMVEGDTPLEAMAREPHPVYPKTELLGGGVLRVYAHSKASRQVLGWHEWFNGHTSVRLRPGERRQFSFALRWVRSYEELDAVLVQHGAGALKVIPAPVVPIDMTARLAVRSRRAVASVRCRGATVRKVSQGGHTLRFRAPGSHTARVRLDDGRWTAVHFRAIEPVADLIRKRAAFIARKQQVVDEKDPRDGAFLMWDSKDETLIRQARAAYFTGGSDELGFADPLFLAAKNAVLPEARERRALARYVERFLHGKLQRPGDWGVVLWFGDEVWHHYRGGDVCRSFNYPHVVNIYHALFKAAKRFGVAGGLDARELLLRAYETAMALYTHTMIAGDAVTIGNMGQSRFLDLLDSLAAEGLLDERKALRAQMGRNVRHYRSVRYPYGSEFAFDTTGYETVYFIRKALGRDAALAAETLDVALATRHYAPAWYLAGNDARSGFGNGRFWRICDEIQFSYMAPLNGLAVQDAYECSGDARLLRSAYASALGVWALVRDDGAGRHLYTWDPARMLFDPWTGEMGLTLFAALEQQRSYVVEDEDFGLVGYGCDVQRVDGRVEIVPRDGVRSHVVWQARRLRVVAEGAAIERLVVLDEGGLETALRGVTKMEREARLRVSVLRGLHELVLGGKRVARVKPAGGVLDVGLTVRTGRVTRVALRRISR